MSENGLNAIAVKTGQNSSRNFSLFWSNMLRYRAA